VFIYPPKAEFNRTLPKSKIYDKAKPPKAVKGKFVAQIRDIVWKYKLSPDTINLTARDGFTEIQIFDINLKQPELGVEVLSVIDRAIPYPIFFRLCYEEQAKGIAAYKRPAADGSGKWVIEEYFETEWADVKVQALPLPVALDMKSLYEQMIKTYIELPARQGESMESLVERIRMVRQHQRELRVLEAKLKSEKQFNRKVDLNAGIRELKHKLTALTK
jgi:hypothetical protein